MFGRFSTKQCHARTHTAFRDATHDGCNAFWMHFAAGDVVRHKQRLSTAHNNVIDHHAHQINTDSVMNIHASGDINLGSHAISAGSEYRFAKLRQSRGIKKTGKSAKITHSFLALRS